MFVVLTVLLCDALTLSEEEADWLIALEPTRPVQLGDTRTATVVHMGRKHGDDGGDVLCLQTLHRFQPHFVAVASA